MTPDERKAAREAFQKLLDASSIGQGAKEMREDPEGHLKRLEAEMFRKRRRRAKP